MPAPSTNQHEPKKVYFSPSEVLLLLDCTKYDLRKWTALIGQNCGREGGKGWRRYSVKELNRMMKFRKAKAA